MSDNRADQSQLDDGLVFHERYKENICLFNIMLFISRTYTLIGKTYMPMMRGTLPIDTFCEKYARKYGAEATGKEE